MAYDTKMPGMRNAGAPKLPGIRNPGGASTPGLTNEAMPRMAGIAASGPNKPPHMHHLSIASAKHLHEMGHIGKAQHDSIVRASNHALGKVGGSVAPRTADDEGGRAPEEWGGLDGMSKGSATGLPGMLSGANQDWGA